MKKGLRTAVLIALVKVLFIISAQAQQKVIQDSTGNYVAARICNPKPEATGKIYTDRKGDVYPVYQTAGGKLYILRKSKKTGKEYKYYLIQK